METERILGTIQLSSPEAWAESLVAQVKRVNEQGLGVLENGRPYSVQDYRSDTHLGSLPWVEEDREKVLSALRNHPEWPAVEQRFRETHGVSLFD